MRNAVLFFLVSVFLLLGCLPRESLAAGYTNVTVQQAYDMIVSKPSLVVLDVRTQSEYESGHLRRAKLIPVTELEGRLNELNQNDEILVYCGLGGRSATASAILVDHGFLHVYNMLGGITEWTAQGYPVYVKYSSIQQTINNANEGDSIYVSTGVYHENIVVNKTVSLVGEDVDATVIDGSASNDVVKIVASHVTIDSFTIQNGETSPDSGISLNNVETASISHCHITGGGYGIYLNQSNHNTIEGNTVTSTAFEAMRLYESSHNNITDNHITANMIDGVVLYGSTSNIIARNVLTANYDGVRLYASSNNTISDNEVTDNYYAIFLAASPSNCISGNNVTANDGNGISLHWSSDGNVVTANMLKANSWLGLSLQDSSDNTIIHNDLIDNAQQAHSNESTDVWDNGCEGNYWSDYNGTDSDGDGVGDMPYSIAEGAFDQNPLMNLYWTPADVNHDLRVDIRDVVRITAAYGTTPSDPYWNPHADIAESYGKIDILDIVVATANYGRKHILISDLIANFQHPLSELRD